MDRQRKEWALIGFVVGGAMGLGIGFLSLWIFNLICTWTGRAPVEITWWRAMPCALVLGLSMAVNMSHPPLGD